MNLATAFIAFVRFLANLLLGLLTALLLVLPWLMRAAALVIWLTAAWNGMNAVWTIYAPFTQSIPLMALQLALILAQVCWLAVVFLYAREQVWGGMFMGGLAVGGASWLALRLQSWEYSGMLFRVLPPALFAILLIHLTVRLRPAARAKASAAAETEAALRAAMSDEYRKETV